MLVMLSLGGSSAKISKVVSQSVDNADFVSFSNVDEMITQSSLRKYSFSRLIFSTKFINTDEDMSKLCDYVRENLGRVEIVYVLSTKQSEYEGIFKAYFDSPLYTIMYVDSPNTKVFTEAISLSIVDLKARYYMLDKPKAGNAKKDENDQKSNGGVQTAANSGNSGVSALDSNGAFGFGNVGLSTEDGADSGNDEKSGYQGNNVNSENSSDVRSLHQDSDNNSSNSSGAFSEIDMSIGDFGSQHTDSGFVGDDELEELENFAKQNTDSADEEELPEEIETPVKEKVGYAIEGVIAPGKVNLVIGSVGSESSAYVLSVAKSAKKAGKHVLVIDMDIESNRVLSYIDTKDFYAKGCEMGIANRCIYSQEGIDFLSNGFSSGAISGIDNVISGSIMNNYEVVLVDCPCTSIKFISDEVFCSCNVVVFCNEEIGKVRETLISLYDRDNVSLEKEIYISKKAKIANRGISGEDIAVIKSEMLFPNGCWLDNAK